MIINPNLYDIKLTNIIGCDLETSGLDPFKDKVLVIAITTRNETFSLAVNHYVKEELKVFLESFKSLEVVIAHNANFDAKFLYTNFGVLLNNLHCTMLAEEVLNNKPTFRPFPSLVRTVEAHTGTILMDSNEKKAMQHSFIGASLSKKITKKQHEYAASDTKYLIPVYNSQIWSAKELGMLDVIRLENKLIPVIIKMELRGCLIDTIGWREEIKKWEVKLDELETRLDDIILELSKTYKTIGGKFTRKRRKQKLQVLDLFGGVTEIQNENLGNVNYGSADQLKELFRLVGEKPPTKKEKKDGKEVEKESLDENSIKQFVNENPSSCLLEFLEVLLEYREYGKLVSTYGDSFLEQLDNRNYIHTSYTQCKTATGRLSSFKPNLQNIPSRGGGKKIRDFFIARRGYKFITCDMNSAEVAIAADYSGEELLLNSIIRGEDMHSKLATVSFSIIFGKRFTITKSEEPVEIGNITVIPDELRTLHKAVTFAKFYKAGAVTIYKTLARYINLFHPPKDRIKIAGRISSALDKEMPQLTKYLSGVIDLANKQGYLQMSKLGRRRWFSANPYGEAANAPIQNTNAEAMKIALIKIDKYLESTGIGRLVMNIHDEAVCEVVEERAEEAKEEIIKIVADSLSWFLDTVNGGASAKIGDHWMK